MAWFLSRLILAGVVKSALALEARSIATYERLRGSAGNARACSDALHESLCRLLAEEELHRKILLDAAHGRLSLSELEGLLKEHVSPTVEEIKPLDAETLSQWGQELLSALEQEEKTCAFYGNLQRMSRIPLVRKAFEALARMEKEHVDVLRTLLGRA
ncbi:MAG TPA: ferritin family protein [Spirochaetia bacterium]|nr:ferritin family protein [Spirochaetia bacterium]